MVTNKSANGDADPTMETLEETAERLKKGTPTPKRKASEAANKRPLVPGDRKEAQKEARAKLAESRERARVGMANGEEKYLTQRDRGPQKRFVRDYVDARYSIGEFVIPVMFVVIILTFIPEPLVQVYGMLALWAFFLVMVIDSVILGFIVRRKLRAKFGEDNVENGVRWYAAMRALQMRPLRLPKPQVKRREYPS